MVTEPSTSQREVYERNLKKLKDEYHNGNWSIPGLSSLLEETYNVRRWLINSELPAAAEVLDLYHC
jgi:hypothetical protein